MKILGIETSCDETAAAVVKDGHYMLSNVVASSIDLHKAYGGVVPEIAARSHLESMLPVVDEALAQAGCSWDDIEAIAVTQGPGLVGSLLIGVLTARTLAIYKNKILIPVNHVRAHPYAAFINSSSLSGYKLNLATPKFPLLALVASGGHTHLVLYESHQKYRVLGQTTDDAVGEAYDKVAKILGLPYPGGPSVERAAHKSDPRKIKLPNITPKNGYNLSFSGLKTAVLRTAQAATGNDFTLPSGALPELLSEHQKRDLAAAFQLAAVSALVNLLVAANQEFKPASIVIAGGVAANQHLRQSLKITLPNAIFPDPALCTDNAAMIASLGFYLSSHSADPYKLEVEPSLVM